MMKKKTLILLTLFSLCSCADQKKPSQPVPNPAPHTSSIPSPVRPSRPIVKQFLQNDREDADRTERENFLRSTLIRRIDRLYGTPSYLLGDDHRLINHRNLPPRSHGMIYSNPYPASPIVHSYNYGGTPIAFSSKFPPAFARNLPDFLKQALLAHPDVATIEIYFTPQINSGADYTNNDPALKAHYWLTPDTPALFGELYNHHHSMMIFNADYDIDRHLRDGQWISANVNTHANTYSPTGITGGGLTFNHYLPHTNLIQPVSFWSIVVDHLNHRAAITLHWMLPEDIQINDPQGLEFPFMQALQHHGNLPQFPNLVDAWEQIPLLNQTPMIQKLRNLIRI